MVVFVATSVVAAESEESMVTVQVMVTARVAAAA